MSILEKKYVLILQNKQTTPPQLPTCAIPALKKQARSYSQGRFLFCLCAVQLYNEKSLWFTAIKLYRMVGTDQRINSDTLLRRAPRFYCGSGFVFAALPPWLEPRTACKHRARSPVPLQRHPRLFQRCGTSVSRHALITLRAKNERPSPPWQLILSFAALVVFGAPLVKPLVDTLATHVAPGSQVALRTSSALSEEEIAEKLRVIPVFCVTDREGRPILTEVGSASNTPAGAAAQAELDEPETLSGALGLLDIDSQQRVQKRRAGPATAHRIGSFYLSYDDASRFLEQLSERSAQDKQNLIRDARIVVVPLDEALSFVTPREGGRGKVPDPSDEFHLVPSEQSVRFAERVLKANGALGVNARIRGVPLFSIRGFALQRVVEKDAGAGSEATQVSETANLSTEPLLLTPVFFTLDDVQFAWDRLRQVSNNQGTALPSKLPLDRVYVTDLRTVIQGMRQGSSALELTDGSADYHSVVFLPSRSAMPGTRTDASGSQRTDAQPVLETRATTERHDGAGR